MTVVTTTQLRENMAEIFESLPNEGYITIRFGRGKKAKYARLSLIENESTSKSLPQNHSLLKFINSNFYKKLPQNAVLSDITDFKKYYNQNFIEDKYSKYDI